jgi:hypothetical protein
MKKVLLLAVFFVAGCSSTRLCYKKPGSVTLERLKDGRVMLTAPCDGNKSAERIIWKKWNGIKCPGAKGCPCD